MRGCVPASVWVAGFRWRSVASDWPFDAVQIVFSWPVGAPLQLLWESRWLKLWCGWGGGVGGTTSQPLVARSSRGRSTTRGWRQSRRARGARAASHATAAPRSRRFCTRGRTCRRSARTARRSYPGARRPRCPILHGSPRGCGPTPAWLRRPHARVAVSRIWTALCVRARARTHACKHRHSRAHKHKTSPPPTRPAVAGSATCRPGCT